MKSAFANAVCRILASAILVAGSLASLALAQNPVPQIVGPVKPMAVAPGSGAVAVTVYGANFVAGAVVNWNGQARATTFISAHELRAQILATDIADNTAGLISVTNPAPGGGNSSASWAQVEVHAPITKVTLKPPHSYSFGGYLLLPADFNNDGTLDLLGQYGGDLDFFKGKGDGTFRFGSIAARYYDSNGGAFGDFNGDGNLDFAYGQSPPNNPTVGAGVMLGDGHGKFKFGSGINNVHDPTLSIGSILAGDFNRDGKLDLVVTNLHGFSLFLGNGDGTFRHFDDIVESQFYVSGIVAGDFNGDGKLDIALAATDLTNEIYVYLYAGNGDGTFQQAQTVYANTALQGGGLMLSDFNGDGKLDLVFRTESQLGIMLGNGDGTFQTPVFHTVGTQGQYTYAIGDINSDGRTDLIVSNYYNFNNAELDVYLGNGDGTFQSPQRISVPEAELGIVVGDFNTDGLLDVLFQTGLGMDALIQARQ